MTMSVYAIEAFLQENAYPYYAGRKDGEPNDWQDSMYRAILHSLSMEELSLVIGCWEQDEECPQELYYKAQGILKFKQRTLGLSNISTPTLLRWYSDKKSKKVSVSAKELTVRFGRETVENRRAILKAFLAGGKKEIEWAARYLLRAPWSRSMTGLVKDVWRKTHNPLIAQVVVKYLPMGFVQAEQDALSEDIGYVYVCTRLGASKSFVIDETRLSTPEYLYVLAKCGRWADMDAVENRLNEYLNEGGWVSSRDIGLVLWALGRLKCLTGQDRPGLAELIIKLKPEFDRRMLMSDIAAGFF